MSSPLFFPSFAHHRGVWPTPSSPLESSCTISAAKRRAAAAAAGIWCFLLAEEAGVRGFIFGLWRRPSSLPSGRDALTETITTPAVPAERSRIWCDSFLRKTLHARPRRHPQHPCCMMCMPPVTHLCMPRVVPFHAVGGNRRAFARSAIAGVGMGGGGVREFGANHRLPLLPPPFQTATEAATAPCRPPSPTTTRTTATPEARTTAPTGEAAAPPVRGPRPGGTERFQAGR